MGAAKSKIMSVSIPQELFDKYKAISSITDVTVSETTRELISAFVDNRLIVKRKLNKFEKKLYAIP